MHIVFEGREAGAALAFMFARDNAIGQSPMWLCGAIAFVSGGVFISQVMMASALGVLFSGDFRYILVSLALFGLGIGSIAVALLRRRFAMDNQRALFIIAALYGATTIAPFLILESFRPGSFPVLSVWTILIACFASYSFAGAFISSLLVAQRRYIPILYACDLFGATILGVASIYTADAFGFSAALQLLFITGCAAFICVWMYSGPYRMISMRAAVCVAIAAAIITPFISFGINCMPTDGRTTVSGDLVEQASNSFSQIDLYQLASTGQDAIFQLWINCSIPTASVKANDLSATERFVDQPRSVVFAVHPSADLLILGAGAGVDVPRALLAGSQDITAVEINQLIFKMTNGYRRDLHVFPYGNPQVTSVVDDGRSYVDQSNSQYDMILLASVKNANLPPSAQLRTFQNLYTIEAFQSYDDHLTQNGMLVIYDWQWFTRQYMVTLQAFLQENGLSWDQHVMVLTENNLPRDFIFFKKSDLTASDIATARAVAATYGVTYNDNPPSVLMAGVPDRVVTDDRPFLAPANMFATTTFGALPPGTFAPMPVMYSLQSLTIIGALLLVLLLVLFKYYEAGTWRQTMPAFFFVGISAGLAALEFVLISKATLLIGNPIYAYATALAALLCLGGLGSLAAHYFDISRRVGALAILMAAILLSYYALEPYFAAALTYTFAMKIIVVFAVAAIPSFIAGMIFPLAFRKIHQYGETYSLWIWGIDASAFVVVTLTISTIVVRYGIKNMLLVGVAGYLIAAVTSSFLGRSDGGLVKP